MISSSKDSFNNEKLIGLACDHGGYELKKYLGTKLLELGFEVIDFGDGPPNKEDDYPDFIVPMAKAVARREIIRGVAICGSGVGACIAANKVPGVRACLIHETFSAHQGVEDDDLNVICFGGLVIGQALAWELLQTFLNAKFSGKERHRRRIEKVRILERPLTNSSPAWAITQGQLKARWTNLTDADLLFVEGKHEELIKRIEDRTGESRNVIEHAITNRD